MNPMDMTCDDFIAANDRLIHKVCSRYTPIMESIKHTTGADYDDLFQLGSIGLMKTRLRFNPDFGLKLSTYAIPMIVGEIQRFLRDNGMVKTPRDIRNLHFKMRKLELEGEDVSVVAAALGVTESKALLVVNYSPHYSSLNEVIYQNEGDAEVTIGDTLKDDFSVENTVINSSIVKEFLGTLTDKERNIWEDCKVHGVRQPEAARRHGCSQPQISRILTSVEAKAAKFGRAKGYARK